ncbi:MAG TPA: tripartite tricarboxylate transporter substrate binding protein [Xanthobacteraceae bacterium]|nr:tripartite tricarboxylate transporter substrate binding protein [Xanthobacteraceae bacterium]
MKEASSRAAIVCGLTMLAALTTQAPAQSYPTRPVTIITPFAAGSVTDATARSIAAHLQETLGQTFIVENRAGAGGMPAASAVAKAAPDGHTLLITTNSTHSAAPGLFKSVPYDPIKDFTPVARIGSFPSLIAANPHAPFKSMQELVAYAKANPGKLSIAHGNSTGHITIEALKQRTKIDIARVPYRSNPAAITDLIAGHIPLMVPDFGTALPQLKVQKIRSLAVITKERSATLPDVPTLHETVMPDYDLLAWAGMFAPAGLPAPIAERISSGLQKMLSKPELKERLLSSGVEVFYTGPKDFDAYVRAELVKWTGLIKEAGIQPE